MNAIKAIDIFLVLKLVIVLIFLMVILIPYYREREKTGLETFNKKMKTSLLINGARIIIEIADTPEKRAKGLSGRRDLAENEGMFFVFNAPYQYSFWMKGMNFPIDIIWIDENFVIADITKNALPGSFPKTFQPLTPILYVLETATGWVDKNNLKIGDMVLLEE